MVTKRTLEGKKATEKCFDNHIRRKKAPKKNEVLRLMGLHLLLFKNITLDGIKIYVYNKFNKNYFFHVLKHLIVSILINTLLNVPHYFLYPKINFEIIFHH